MIGTKWILWIAFHFTFHQSIALPNNRIYGDVNNDEAMIDELGNILQNGDWPEEHPNFIDQYYQDSDYKAVPLKIPFAVPPSDVRYNYPTSVLKEASYHSNVYGHDALSPESKMELQKVWDEDRRRAYLAASYQHMPEELQNNGAPLHGQQHHVEEQKVEQAPDAHLQASPHHVQQQLPHFMVNKSGTAMSMPNFYFVALVSGLTAVAVCAVVGAGICYFRLHKSKRDAAEAEYPAYGVTGPNKELSPGAADRKLAQSAHMFHYQHQKQQMIALEKSSGEDRHCSAASDSEEEGDEGDYTVYECPGLAPTGEMEVKNPLFSDDPTPATPPAKGAAHRRDSIDGPEDE